MRSMPTSAAPNSAGNDPFCGRRAFHYNPGAVECPTPISADKLAAGRHMVTFELVQDDGGAGKDSSDASHDDHDPWRAFP